MERVLRGVAGWLFALMAIALVGARPVLAQDAPVTFTPTADAYVLDGAWSNSNFGADVWLYTRTSNGQNYDSYLKFDTTGVGSVWRAKLRFNASVSANANIGVTAHSVAATGWSESAITWNNKPARGAALGSVTVTGTSFVYYEIDVTDYLAAEKAAGRNVVSFALHNSASSNQYVWMRSREAASNPPQLVITPNVTVVSLLPAVSTVALGASTTLNLTISSPQATDTVVPIAASPAGIVSVPAQVTVAAGQTSAPVPVGTLAYGQAGITASLNGSSTSAGVNVVPPPVAVTALEPASFTMTVGAISSFTVRINAAQAADTEIALAASNPAVLQVPASVIVPQGATSATFTATGLAVGDSTLTASANGTSQVSSIHVSPQPAAIVSLLPTPLPLQQGATGSLTVTINAAQEVATTIVLANSAPEVATVPESVVIAAGAVSAQVPVTTASPGSTVITASVNGTSAAATVEVTPPPPVVSALTPEILSLPKGTPGTLRVTVSRAPNAATPVALVSSDPSVASVPPQVNIPAGALFADFPVMSNAQGQAAVTASLNGGSASASVTVGPAELANLTLAPQAPVRYVGETVAFTAMGVMTDGTSEDFTSRVTWSSSSPAVATINAGGVASALAAGQTTIRAAFTFTAVQTGQAVTIEQSTVLTVVSPVALALSTPTTSLQVTQSATVTVTSSDPAPSGGLLVNLSGGGTGAGTFPAAVTIPASQTSASFQFTATGAGSYTITASAQNRLPGSINFTIAPQLAINAVTPSSADVGATITLSGTGFDPAPASNALAFRGINNTTVPAAALTATPSTITVRVPPLAESGPITLTNSRGTVQSAPFTVVREQDFQLVVSPAALTVYQGASGTAQAQLSSTGTKSFTGLVTLSVAGLPAGVTASFAPAATLSAFQAGAVTLTATGSAVPGSYPVTVQAAFAEGGTPFLRSSSLTVTLSSAAGVVGIRGRFVDPDGRGVGGVIVRADATGVQVTSDAAGNFQLTGIPSGRVPLRVDATPANPLYPIYPTIVDVPASGVAQLPDWTLAPPPADEEFTPINNAAQAQIITDPRYPGFELTLPQGVRIVGHDGVVKTRVAVQRHDPDKFGVPLPPIPTRSIYQFHFGTPMGGIPEAALPVSVPNDLGLDPGQQTEIWFYDGLPNAPSGEWKLLGMGTVSLDGKKVVANPGVGLTRFCGKCSAVCVAGGQQDSPPPPPDCCPDPKSQNPVTLATGQETPTEIDLSITGLMPVNISRTFRPFDAYNGIAGTFGSFGFGWASDHESTLLVLSSELVRLILPGNKRVNFTRDSLGQLTAPTDPRFQGAALTNLGNNVYELKYKNGIVWKFEPFNVIHWLTEKRHPDGKSVLIARRPADGKMINIQTNGGRGVTFSYGANGFISEARDSGARVVRYTYNAQSRIDTVTDPENGVTRYTYVDDSELAPLPACPSVAGGVRLKSRLRPGKTQALTQHYGPSRRVLRETLEDGTEVRFNYAVVGACVAHVSNPSARCEGTGCPSVDSWENFQAGWRISGGTIVATTVIDAQGKAETQRFNQAGIGKETIDGQGQKMTFTRDVNNRVTSKTDALGRVTRFVYDAQGNVLRKTDSAGRIFDYTYDPAWNKLASETRYLEDGTPVVTRLQYGPTTGNLQKRIDPENNFTEYTYTAHGQIRTIANGLGQSITREYNTAGDLVRVLDPLNNEIQLTPDALGRVVTMTNALGHSSHTRYNGLDQVLEVTDALQGLTQYRYDPQRRLEAVLNPLNSPIESYQYDLADRITVRTDAKSKPTAMTYDSAGRLLTFTDRNTRTSTFEYDAQKRVIRIVLPDATQTRTYDAAGRLVRVQEGTTSLEYVYDSVDRLIREIQDASGIVNRVEYQYDNLDRIVLRTVNGADATAYSYDKANRLTAIAYRNQITSFEWDAASRLKARMLPIGIRQEIEYDDAGRITTITYKKPDQTVIEAIGYVYDAAGQRISRTQSQASVPETPFTAQYDAANRMTSITFTAAGLTYNLSYDDNGSLIRKQNASDASDATTYVWDSRRRLVELNAPGLAATMRYDGAGRRVERTVNGETARYVYDGPNTIAELRGSQTHTLLTGLQIDEVIARYSSAGARVYLTDALNSVLAQANDDQSIHNYYGYSPYGESVQIAPDEGNPIEYTARENDETGLYYYRARYYDPVLKRFISEDPLGRAAGLNFYSYVDGSPISHSDPTGLATYGGGTGLAGWYGVGGGGGYTVVSCCDENGVWHNFHYVKVCGGVMTPGLSGSYMVGITNMNGPDCRPDKFAGYFLEFTAGGAGRGAETDIGLTDNGARPIPMPTGFSGTNAGGAGVATPGLAAMLCWYWFLGDYP